MVTSFRALSLFLYQAFVIAYELMLLPKHGKISACCFAIIDAIRQPSLFHTAFVG